MTREPYQNNQSQNESASFWRRLKTKSQGILNWLWILVAAVYLIIGASRNIINNYQLNQESLSLKKDVERLKLEKKRLEALAVYYNTDDYKEKELRKRLLLKRPGEYVIAISEDGESAFVKTSADKLKTTDGSKTVMPLEPKRPNWEKWLDYFKGDLN